MFDNINVNPCKNEGFLTSIPCIPIPEYGQSNAPLVRNDRDNHGGGVLIYYKESLLAHQVITWDHPNLEATWLNYYEITVFSGWLYL